MKIHAVDGGEQCWWQEHHRCHREDLDDVVLLDVDHAEGRVQQEDDLVRQEGNVIRERGDVTRRGPYARLQRLTEIPLIGGMHEKGKQPSERISAIARL